MTLHTDPKYDHFVLDLPPEPGTTKGEVVGVDLGTRLHVTATGAYLTPDDARVLAGALTTWADRHVDEAREPEAIEREVVDLFDLMGGEHV